MSPTQTARLQFDALILTTNLFAPAGQGVAATEPEYRFDDRSDVGTRVRQKHCVFDCGLSVGYERDVDRFQSLHLRDDLVCC